MKKISQEYLSSSSAKQLFSELSCLAKVSDIIGRKVESKAINSCITSFAVDKARITYKDLEFILFGCGLDLECFLMMIGYTREKDPDAVNLAKVLETLTLPQLIQLKTLAEYLAGGKWFAEDILFLPPTKKILRIMEAKYPHSERRKLENVPDSLNQAWADRHEGTRVRTEDLPLVADYFGISMHYIFSFTDVIGYYSDVPTIEEIIDRYFFLPDRMKRQFRLSVLEVQNDVK